MKKIKDSFISLIEKGFFHIFTGNILVKAVSFISSFLVVRMVTKDEYAYFAYADNLYAYIILFSGLSLSTAFLKISSESGDETSAKSLFIFCSKIGSVIQLLLSFLLIIYSVFGNLTFEESQFLIVLLFLTPCLDFFMQMIQSYNRFSLRNDIFAKTSVINALLLSFLTIILVSIFGIIGLPLARIISYAISIIWGWKKSDIESVQASSISPILGKKTLSLGVSITIATIFSSAMPLNEVFLVNHLLKDSIITANFKAASLLPSQLLIITNSFILFIFPLLSKKASNKFRFNLIFKYSLLNLTIILIAGSFGILITPFIVNFVYGSNYIDAIPLSYMLWIVRIVNTGIRMVPMNMLPAIGKEKFSAYFSVVTCIIHFILDYYFILNYGIYGIAYASIFVYVISAITYWIVLKKWSGKND
ncbi:oligosaccharide flippase family protein [Enterococcus asini]|uniref:oligosaccharide flippase family protein n=1 Tax=Enterococcus asini TaxID=57732 RepID=UPI001E41C168|nr:oligosaccharide flippase family protein [Enterococcus asini]MCD5030036.1 oligosaccharide flippase family protein [Enterococcus asini]